MSHRLATLYCVLEIKRSFILKQLHGLHLEPELNQVQIQLNLISPIPGCRVLIVFFLALFWIASKVIYSDKHLENYPNF